MELSQIKLCSPKRHGQGLACKIKYKGSQLQLDNVQISVLSVKRLDEHIYLKIRVPRDVAKLLIKIENSIVKLLEENSDEWFKGKIASHLLEEYFQTSIQHDRVIKMKLINLLPEDDDMIQQNIGRSLNVSLALEYIQVFKKHCILYIRPTNVQESDAFINDGSDSDISETDLEHIKADLVNNMLQRIDGYVNAVTRNLMQVDTIKNELQAVDSLDELQSLNDRLENILLQ
jgi:hypothetical protein